jgi:hypothetical protein
MEQGEEEVPSSQVLGIGNLSNQRERSNVWLRVTREARLIAREARAAILGASRSYWLGEHRGRDKR